MRSKKQAGTSIHATLGARELVNYAELDPIRHQDQVDIAAAEKLAYHLMEHPETAGQPTATLAAEFGVPADFVRDLKQLLRGSITGSNAAKDAWLDFRDKLGLLGSNVSETFDRATCAPYWFVAVSMLVCVGCIAIAFPFGSGLQWEQHTVSLKVSTWAASCLTVGFMAHLACYFRHGQLGIALRGTFLVLVLAVPMISIALWIAPPTNIPHNVIALGTILAVLILGIGFIYAIFAAAATVMGGAFAMRQREVQQVTMSRQELLEQLLTLRDRLHDLSGKARVPSVTRLQSMQNQFRRNGYFWSIIIPAVLAILAYLFTSRVQDPSTNAGARALFTIAEVLTSIVYVLAVVVLSFLAGSVRRAVGVAVTAAAVGIFVESLTVASSGASSVVAKLASEETAQNLVLALIIGVFAGLGARIEERAAHDTRLNEDDPAALIARWIRIQWQLSPQRKNVCVMVVDTKASSQMKAESDPLVAEWSFREYQKFIESISARWGGSVHATSGDGAVVAFQSPNEAFAAARAIQREVDPFNRNVNRLALPFRLRIGLHVGYLQGELDDVEFTEVIDIAAHIEAAAPVGGIALSKAVADALEGEGLAQIKETIDGHDVYFALNPTGD